jgi:hypothetical protein
VHILPTKPGSADNFVLDAFLDTFVACQYIVMHKGEISSQSF